jgi:hypothetical protein
MDFYLGTHHPHWLRQLSVPLMVSRRRLSPYKSLPVANAGWMLDSGGFSELSMFGEWTVSERQYASEVTRYADQIGRLEYAATQDWMCEPFILKKTGLSVSIHHQRTITSYLALTMLAPDLPWFPILQGWSIDDYLRHIEAYQTAGVILADLPRVGLGSVCRRQATREVAGIVKRLFAEGLKLHGFGVKKQGLSASRSYLRSADSMAWSFRARREPPLEGCTHKNCANCAAYAMKWLEALDVGAKPHGQLAMNLGGLQL